MNLRFQQSLKKLFLIQVRQKIKAKFLKAEIKIIFLQKHLIKIN